jgi:hypothetical protein
VEGLETVLGVDIPSRYEPGIPAPPVFVMDGLLDPALPLIPLTGGATDGGGYGGGTPGFCDPLTSASNDEYCFGFDILGAGCDMGSFFAAKLEPLDFLLIFCKKAADDTVELDGAQPLAFTVVSSFSTGGGGGGDFHELEVALYFDGILLLFGVAIATTSEAGTSVRPTSAVEGLLDSIFPIAGGATGGGTSDVCERPKLLLVVGETFAPSGDLPMV